MCLKVIAFLVYIQFHYRYPYSYVFYLFIYLLYLKLLLSTVKVPIVINSNYIDFYQFGRSAFYKDTRFSYWVLKYSIISEIRNGSVTLTT